MLLAEDLLLLITDDASGRLSAPPAQVDAGLGGANLMELTLMHKVELSDEHDISGPGRIIVRDPAPTSDAVLDAALNIIITHQGQKPSTLIRPLGKNLRQTLYERLASSGLLRAGQGRILGLFPARRWPAQDSRHEAEVRQQLIQALVQQDTPDDRSAALIALLHAWVRPRLARWGATDEELAGPYPGADLVPGGKRYGAMAVTIDARPDQVWPWLVQMGWDRGGWYSWDRLDNAGRPSAREVHPEWQDLAVGDQLKVWTPGGVTDAYRVAVLEPNRFLGLLGYSDLLGRTLDLKQPRPSAYMEGLWGFLLSELPGGRTRLVISGYQTLRPRWLERFVVDWLYMPGVWVMQARMLAVLKRNIERANRAQTHATSSGGSA